MCNLYTSPHLVRKEREWAIGRPNPVRWWGEVLCPRGQGSFMRRAQDDAKGLLRLSAAEIFEAEPLM